MTRRKISLPNSGLQCYGIVRGQTIYYKEGILLLGKTEDIGGTLSHSGW